MSYTWRQIIEAPRWAGFSKFLKDECFIRRLALTIDVDKGWLRETVRFEVSGEEDKVKLLRTEINLALDSYNKRLEAKK